MSQVNLLPPEIRQKAKVRTQAILIGLAGAALIGFVIVLSLLQGIALRSASSDLNAQIAVNSGLQHQVDDLQPYEARALELEAQQEIVDTAMAYEISWSSALRDVQLVLPDDMSIASFSGNLSATTAEALTPPLGGGPAIIGDINVVGSSVGSLRLARWLSKLDEVKGWGNPWMSSATWSDGDIWTFNTVIDVFENAATARGQVAPA